MHIVVAMKQIPDLQQIRLRDRKAVLDDAPLTFGAIDKNALEAGVRIKEEIDGKLTVITIGNSNIEDTVKEALAAGADEAYLVCAEELDGADASVIAEVLASSIKQMDNVDLLILGEGSGDNYSGQIGSRVAEILDWPQVGYASSIEISGKSARLTRALEDCEQRLELDLPAVITVISGINEARIPSVTQILKAGRKPKQIIDYDRHDFINPIVTISNLAPENQRKRIVVKNVDELMQALRSENLLGR